MSLLPWTLALALLAAPAGGPPVPPWDRDPFGADSREVLAAAAAQASGDEGQPVVVLSEEGRFLVDDQGRVDYTYRFVYRVQTQEGAEGWASVEAGWAPWYEERPQIRARVVTADGQAHLLDPATIDDAPEREEDERIYSDRRRLRAPLPALGPGSVVEEEIRLVDRLPLFEGGSVSAFYLGNGVPTRRTRIVVDAPEALPLRHALKGLPGGTVDRLRESGRVRLSVEVGPLGPVPAAEDWMPFEVPRRPQLTFSTGASWGEVARAYGRLVDEQIGAPAAPAPRPGQRREQVAARLLAQLQEQVRYTGVELGEAALVPRPPAEVMARRYGDCKDMSTLLVARLRAEGVPAQVALVRRGPGEDVDPELPGLGVFDHAIVALPGSPTLWIDPTAEHFRVGELSPSLQDRWALVTGTGTELVRLPSSTSADNVLRKTREVTLAETGGGRVVETTTASGAIEQAFRSYYAGASPEDARTAQADYARSEHEAELVASRHGAPGDLAVPFRLEVESAGSGRAQTEGATALVRVPPAGLFSYLPDAVTEAPEGEGGEPARQHPFVQMRPHRVEWTYRITPPSGFTVKKLPPAEKLALGPASLEVGFEAKPDGRVEGRLTFDSGPRVVPAEAYPALRDGVRAWMGREPLVVEFEDQAVAALAAGRTCEGLAELRRRVAAEPRRAPLHERLALGLLQAGFGEEAREEARQAVALDQRSGSARRVLGWTLEHDLLGRRFQPGCDLPGAEAAYRQGKQLDPRDVVLRASLAILLEHGSHGVHFGPGARLEEAVVETEAIRKEFETDQYLLNELIALMNLRRFEAVEALATSRPEDPNRNEVLLVALAARSGPAAAIAEAARRFPDPARRRDALLHAGNSLLELRLYPASAALLAESVNGAADAAERRARADFVATLRRHEDLTFREDDPAALLPRMLVALSVGDLESLARLIDFGDEERRTMARDPEAARRGLAMGLRSTLGSADLTPTLVDRALATSEAAVEGDAAAGYRIRWRAGNRSSDVFALHRDGALRLAGVPGLREPLGLEAWRRAAAGDLEGARRWLDWAREGLRSAPAEDPFDAHGLALLWEQGSAGGADQARLAAAATFVSAENLTQGIQALQVGAEADPGRRDVIDVVRARLLERADRLAEVLPVLERLRAAHLGSLDLWLTHLRILRRLGRYEDARALAAARLKTRPDDEDALRALANLAVEQGRYDEGEEWFGRLAARGRELAGDLNNRAWNAVLRGHPDATALDRARRSVEGEVGSAARHTLATLYAETGRFDEARQVLVRAIAGRASDEAGADDWYVVGRLAEHCGLVAQARRAYERVTEGGEERLDATAVLARRRLAGLPAGTSPRRGRR